MAYPTKLPWRVKGTDWDARVFSPTGLLANVTGLREERGANARLIVTAVNSHKKLLRALRSCRDMLLVLTDAQFSNPKVVDILRDQIGIADEALEGLE